MPINLGDKVKDQVTGFTGIVVCTSQWLHGCKRITVQPEGLNKEGKPFDNCTFDEMQLTVVKRGVVKATATNPEDATTRSRKAITGGPRDDKAALRRN